MGKGFSKKIKQMREMQSQITAMQDKMTTMEVVGSAGNGLVELTLNGNQELVSIKIKPECVDPEDIEGLEDLIKEAHRQAATKISSGMDNMSLPQGMPNLDLDQFGL